MSEEEREGGREEERTDRLSVDADHLDGVDVGFERPIAKGERDQKIRGRSASRAKGDATGSGIESFRLTSSRWPSYRTTD